jgi:hypothetical protein
MQVTLRGSSSILKDWCKGLDVDSVLRGQGADPAVIRSRSPAVTRFAEQALADGMPLLSPVVIYCRLPVESVRHERIALQGGALLTGKLVAEHLAPAQEIAVIAATIGGGVEDLASQVLKQNPMYALALDGFGNAAIETLAVAVCRHFSEAAAAEGMSASIPVSPGQMGWTAEVGQKEIFTVLDTDNAGLKLSSYGVMIPRKSLSMVVGVGPEMTQGASACSYCSMQDTCRYQDITGRLSRESRK